MTDTTSSALRTALAYYQAWTSHDLDKAMSYIADNIVCDAPAGHLEGTEASRGFLGPFVQIGTGHRRGDLAQRVSSGAGMRRWQRWNRRAW